MNSRVLSRLQTLLSAFALLIVLASLTPAPVHAKVYYEIDDRSEGDPGDGVLDPSIEGGGGGSSGTSSPATVPTTSAASFLDSWFQPWGDFYLVPVILPGNGTIIFLPRAWSHVGHAALMSQGRWHDAP